MCAVEDRGGEFEDSAYQAPASFGEPSLLRSLAEGKTDSARTRTLGNVVSHQLEQFRRGGHFHGDSVRRLYTDSPAASFFGRIEKAVFIDDEDDIAFLHGGEYIDHACRLGWICWKHDIVSCSQFSGRNPLCSRGFRAHQHSPAARVLLSDRPHIASCLSDSVLFAEDVRGLSVLSAKSHEFFIDGEAARGPPPQFIVFVLV